MTLREALLVLLFAVPSSWAFNFENLLYKVHVCPHLPICPPPMCGPGVKIHECHGLYKMCSSDDTSCDFARCKAGDTDCYYSCEAGSCQRIYSCEEGDCSTIYNYGKCNDPRCNYISTSSGGSGDSSSGSGSRSGSSGSYVSGSSGSSGSDSGGSVISQAATGSTSSQALTAKTWMTVISLVAVALVASVILANVLLHRKDKKRLDHPLTGSLERRMRLFTRGIPSFSRRAPVEASAYKLENDEQVV